MTEGNNPVGYCGQCGNPIHAGDRFCGGCGATVLPAPQQAEQVIPGPVAAAHGASAHGSRKPLLLAGAIGVLVMLVVGGGVLALAGLGYGDGLLGASESPSRTPDNREGAAPQPEETEGYGAAEPTASAPTTVDFMQEFVSGYYDALAGEDWAAAYSMLDEESRQRITEEEWTQAQANLAESGDVPPIASATLEGPYVSETQAPFSTNVSLSYEDGTSETVEISLVSEYVVDEASDYHRHLTDEEVSYLEGFVEKESAEPTVSEPTDFGLSPSEETAREAAEQYYYAVDYEAWETTYYNLDAESKALFTEEEWIAKNQWYADVEGLELDSMSVDATMDGEEAADVTVYRTFTDGTSITRDTRFVWEGGYWRHSLTEEEKDIFMPELSYEEFVAAQ